MEKKYAKGSRRGWAIIAGRLLAFLVLLLPILVGCSSTTTPPANGTTTINLGLPAQALASPAVGSLPGTTLLRIRLTLKPIRSAKPGGGDLSSFQQQVQAFFRGVKRVQLSPVGTYLAVDAPAATMATILKTHFVLYRQSSGQVFFAPARPPSLPMFLAERLVAIIGLDNYSEKPRQSSLSMPTKSQRKQITRSSSAVNCAPVPQTLPPRSVASAYGDSQFWSAGYHGEGMTVNLVEIDAFDQNDLANYLTCIGFGGPAPRVITVDGAPNQIAGEATLDLEMAAGLARSVNLVDYQTNGNTQMDIWVQVNDALQQIIADHATGNVSGSNIVSISFGVAENLISAQDRMAIDQSLQTLVQMLKIPVFVASGDRGAYTNGSALSVSFPASDPWAIAVGGTVLAVDGMGNRQSEVAWPGDGVRYLGSGGGNSAVFPRPSWQNAPGIPSSLSTGGRQVPDVAAVASNLAFFLNGSWIIAGGTSAAAPIWAAGTALVNEGLQRQARTPLTSPQQLYTLASQSQGAGGVGPFFDITQGTNHTYSAGPGWDYVTGLGTPNFLQIYQALLTSPVG